MRSSIEADERSRITDALIGVSVEHRYANTTLEMVLERAGVEEKAFRRYFDDLDDCFCQTAAEIFQAVIERIIVAFASETGWRNQLRAAAHAMLVYLGEETEAARLISIEVEFGGDQARLIRDEAMHAFVMLIDQGRQEMDDPDSLTPFTAETIGGAILARIQSALEHDEMDTFEDGVKEMMYMAVLPYLGPEKAREELYIEPPSFH